MNERSGDPIGVPRADLLGDPLPPSRPEPGSRGTSAGADAGTARGETSQPGFAGRTRYTLLEYEAALANASIGIAFTRDRKFFLCNPKFAEIFGWAPNELIGQPGECVYPSRESYSALGAIAVPVLSAGKQLDLEWEMKRKDGSNFLARVIAKTINPENPRQGTVWIVDDVTEEKRASDEMNRLLREQDAILETVSAGILFVKDRRIMRCTRRFEEMYGYGPGELNGEPTVILYANEKDFQSVGQAYEQKLAKGQQYRMRSQMLRKDGSTFWARITGRAADATDPAQGSVWLSEDVTDQQRADEEMQRLVLEQQALLNNVVVGITIVRDRKVIRCNRRFEELFGMAPGEGIHSSTRSMYFTKDEFDRGAKSYAEIDSGGTHAREQWLKRKDGSGYWCRMTGRAVEPGEPSKGYVWLFEDISERKRADEDVQRLLKEQNAILENALIGIAFLKDRRVMRCNRRFEEIFGYEAGALLNQPTQVLYKSDKVYNSGDPLYEEVWSGSTLGRELRMKKRDGTEFWCFLSGRAVQPGDPAQGSVWLFEDVTADKSAGDRIRQLAHEQELILQNATVGIAFVRNRVIQRSNRFLEQMTGWEPGTLLGESSEVLFADHAEWLEAGRKAFESTVPGETHVDEVRFKRVDGSSFLCRTVGRRIDAGGDEQEWIWSFDDVSAERATRESLEKLVAERTAELQSANKRLEAEIAERKLAESRAKHLADHDALTGLPNRRILEDRLTQALALSYRNRKQTAAMFIDLDRFKTINDSLGHAVGDHLLQEVALRLVKQLRVGDTVCRIGGDEFVVVLPEIVRGSDAAQVAVKIIETLSEPIVLEEREITVTPSIGISVFPEDGSDAETLIHNADAAMYHAKEMGRSNYQFFTEQMNLAASRRLTLENDLRRAVQKNELVVYYQPISELETGCTVMHEALLRWKHPTRGLVPPIEFIQLAEDTGLILKIGEQALRDACNWAVKIGVDKRMPVAVNISARQFNDPKLVEMVARTLEETGLPAEMLELEITESTVMKQTDATLAMLKKLKELGVSLAIDDFGTGYSSLAYLKRFPVDKLKIDKSFITDVPMSRDHNAIVTAIISLAHALSLRVVAEGVETEAQLEFLQGARCDLIQGYLAGRPIDADSAASEYL